MEIKVEGPGESGGVFRKFFGHILRRDVRFFFVAFVLIGVFVLGGLSGLLISGFFGTYSDVLQVTVDTLHDLGFRNLQNKKMILDENVKIPFNYLIGQFSDPQKIEIDIAFEDWQKIVAKRDEALKQGVLLSSSDDFVPATISSDNESERVRLRLKGDWTDHLEGHKWSFRINVRGDNTFNGMEVFSIQDPETRRFLNEKIYLEMLKKEGLIALRYDFVKVHINGENRGIYAFEEHFDKRLLENNQRRGGVILKFNEDLMWEEIAAGKFSSSEDLFYGSNIESFDNDIIDDSELSLQFKRAVSMLESFRQGEMSTSEVFDVDMLAKYFAINTLTGADHASEWTNIRFYYNPLNSRIEPIGFDAYPGNSANEVFSRYLESSEIERDAFYELIFSDEIFFQKYLEELNRISEPEYLDSFFEQNEAEFNRMKRILHKDTPSFHYSTDIFYSNQEEIKLKLTALDQINAYLASSNTGSEEVVVSIGNLGYLPLEITGLVYNGSQTFELVSIQNKLGPKPNPSEIEYHDFKFSVPAEIISSEGFKSILGISYRVVGQQESSTKEVYPWENFDRSFLSEDYIIGNFEDGLWFDVDEQTREIRIRQGEWKVNRSVIFPADYLITAKSSTTLNLVNNARIVSYSPINFIGSIKDPIKITSSDGSGEGVLIIEGLENSYLENVLFSGLSNPTSEGGSLTGAITFYRTNVSMKNIEIINARSEDGMNLVSSSFKIENIIFKNCFSDCLDVDFGEGMIHNVFTENSGNDGLDFSGSTVSIKNFSALSFGDKGLSVGENSNISIIDSFFDGGYIGIASKDSSFVSIGKSDISNCKYGIAVYQKKPEFGPSSMEAAGIVFDENDEDYILEKGSTVSINEVLVLGDAKNVYSALYDDKL